MTSMTRARSSGVFIRSCCAAILRPALSAQNPVTCSDPAAASEEATAVSELLVVVDMQNGFLREGNLASDQCLAVLPAVRREVDEALAAGRRVLFTADTHEIDDAEFAVFPEHCVRGTREAGLVDELLPLLARDDVLLLPKRRYSALFETEMEGHLHRFGIDSVRICGVCTDICVLYTTADLRNRDFPVTVAVPATGTFDSPGHPAEVVREFSLMHLQRVLGATLDYG
jgi:nicotinamidase/pyrazinamidase